ncbi:hypothetical protein SAMN02745181_1269 [Rubritalea squalenifaciens DSM 18772]|uniref:Uncharacterized protein n=1 Tax=Rubritalea squalenifaciens DSM 18772 TaxID=1123071 RepID=A0A1M6GU48_9BACT|nr:hypothetical protein [Rubritalea squalenifaciens]SHJ13498.1 hypothetical protein SAMN02745181_1269 [Rubritalea squalenifaciens DSM 18772]
MKDHNSLLHIPSLVETVDPRWRHYAGKAHTVSRQPLIQKFQDDVIGLGYAHYTNDLTFMVSGWCPKEKWASNTVKQADITLEDVLLSGRPDFTPTTQQLYYLKTILKKVSQIYHEPHIPNVVRKQI